MRRSTFVDQAVTYGAVGGTQAADLQIYPPEGFRPRVREARLGSGDERFRIASREALSWCVQRRSGVEVTELSEGPGASYHGVGFAADGSPAEPAEQRDESVFDEEGGLLVGNGMTAVLRTRVAFLRFRAPVRVVYVVDEADRAGFAYGSLPGHPLRGEEALLVEHRADDSVWIVVRAFSRPAHLGYRLLAPAMRIVQGRLVRRYLRALRPGGAR